MGLNMEGNMFSYLLYGYDVTQYKEVLKKETLQDCGIENEDCVPDYDMPYSLRYNDKLFIGLILDYFDDMPNDCLIGLNEKDFKNNKGYNEFCECLNKIKEKTGIEILESPRIMTLNYKSDDDDDDCIEDFNPYSIYMDYMILYGYDLTSLDYQENIDMQEKYNINGLYEVKKGTIGFPILDNRTCPLGGYIIDKMNPNKTYVDYVDFYKNIEKIKNNLDFIKITNIVKEIFKNKELPKLGIYALKRVISE